MLNEKHPCTERNATSIMMGEGKEDIKDDVGCCMKVQKHNKCLELREKLKGASRRGEGQAQQNANISTGGCEKRQAETQQQ